MGSDDEPDAAASPRSDEACFGRVLRRAHLAHELPVRRSAQRTLKQSSVAARGRLFAMRMHTARTTHTDCTHRHTDADGPTDGAPVYATAPHTTTTWLVG